MYIIAIVLVTVISIIYINCQFIPDYQINSNNSNVPDSAVSSDTVNSNTDGVERLQAPTYRTDPIIIDNILHNVIRSNKESTIIDYYTKAFDEQLQLHKKLSRTIHPNIDESSTSKDYSYSSYKFNNVERLHSALQRGSVCSDATITSPSYIRPSLERTLAKSKSTTRLTAMQAELDYLIKKKSISSIIEYNNNDIVNSNCYYISNHNHDVTCVILNIGEDSSTSSYNYLPSTDANSAISGANNDQPGCIAVSPGSNLYVTNNQHNNNYASFLTNKSTTDCAQVIPDLELLVSDLLPYEFEDVIGKILCRCHYSYMPKTLPESPYFAYWDSVSSLIAAALKSQQLLCWASYGPHIDYVPDSTLADKGSVNKRNTGSYNSKSASTRSKTLSTSPDISTSYIVVTRSAATGDDTDDGSYSNTMISTTALSELPLDTLSRIHLLSHIASAVANTNISPVGNSIYLQGAIPVIEDNDERALPTHNEYRKRRRLEQTTTTSSSSSTTSSSSTGTKYRSSFAKSNTTTSSTSSSITSATAVEGIDNLHESDSIMSWVFSETETDSEISTIDSLIVTQFKAVAATTDNSKKTFVDHTSTTAASSAAATTTGSSGTTTAIGIKSNLKKSSKPSYPSRLSSTTTTTATKTSLSATSRTSQQAIQKRESKSYNRWINILRYKDNIITRSGLARARKSGLVYVFGKHSSVLGLKIAKLMTVQNKSQKIHKNKRKSAGLVVNVLTDSISVRTHQLMATMMGIHNNIICFRPQFSHVTLTAMLKAPERAEVAIIQSDIIIHTIVTALTTPNSINSPVGDDDNSGISTVPQCNTDMIEESIAILLAASDVTYIELPSIQLLQYLINMHSNSNCGEILGNTYKSVTDLLENAATYLPNNIINAGINEIVIDDKISNSEYKVHVFKIELSHNNNNNNNNNVAMQSNNLSLFTILQLGIVDSQKKLLLKMLIEMPLWKLSAASIGSINSKHIYLKLANNDNSNRGNNKLVSPKWTLFLHNSSNIINHNDIPHIPGTTITSSNNNDNNIIGVTTGEADRINQDIFHGRAIWQTLQSELQSHPSELANGEFSFVEHNSKFGYLSIRLAAEYPNATILSLERNNNMAKHHVTVVNNINIKNNAICLKEESDIRIFKNIYESPELFRYQLFARDIIDGFASAASLDEWGLTIGAVLSTALTTFFYVPDATQVSWAMHTIMGEVFEYAYDQDNNKETESSILAYYLPQPIITIEQPDNYNNNKYVTALSEMSAHPVYVYRNFENQFLLDYTRVRGGSTSVSITAINSIDNNEKFHNNNEPPEDLPHDINQISQNGFSLNNKAALPLLRCDIINMTRHVHHHYDYSKDGHKRTYTMVVNVNDTATEAVTAQVGDPSAAMTVHSSTGHVKLISSEHGTLEKMLPPVIADAAPESGGEDVRLDHNHNSNSSGNEQHSAIITLPLGHHPNQHTITNIRLYRDKDIFPIPYTSIYGITLISALRMGLFSSQRDALFKEFLRLPLYEDMAPWNVVLMGQKLDYIDYDTREYTFDKVIPQTYQVMSVLMNYKRTVEDFKRCGSKSNTVYGLPFVSDCVGTSKQSASLSCPDLKFPVPCPDGQCHSDYVSCLRSLSSQAEELVRDHRKHADGVNGALRQDYRDYVESDSADSSRSGGHRLRSSSMDKHLAAAMRSMVGSFDNNKASYKYEDIFE